MDRSASAVKRRVGDLVERCRAAGLSVTPQRLAVYEAVLKSETHPSPEDLFRSIRRRMPGISLATVYKALEALQSLGVVHEVSRLSETKRFDANTDSHHHLVCTSCGSVTDFYDAKLDRLSPRRPVSGFTPTAVRVQVLGLCAACARR